MLTNQIDQHPSPRIGAFVKVTEPSYIKTTFLTYNKLAHGYLAGYHTFPKIQNAHLHDIVRAGDLVQRLSALPVLSFALRSSLFRLVLLDSVLICVLGGVEHVDWEL